MKHIFLLLIFHLFLAFNRSLHSSLPLSLSSAHSLSPKATTVNINFISHTRFVDMKSQFCLNIRVDRVTFQERRLKYFITHDKKLRNFLLACCWTWKQQVENPMLWGKIDWVWSGKALNRLEKHEEFSDARARETEWKKITWNYWTSLWRHARWWSFLFGLIKHIFAHFCEIFSVAEKKRTKEKFIAFMEFWSSLFAKHKIAAAVSVISSRNIVGLRVPVSSKLKVLVVAFFSPPVLRWIIQ